MTATSFDINISPCRGCEKELPVPEWQGPKLCIDNCVELLCWQKAAALAEKVGAPSANRCPICLRESQGYCQGCREKAADEIIKRNTIAPVLISPFAPKSKSTNPKSFKWFRVRQKKVHRCEFCGDAIETNEECLARHTAPNKGNYKHAHPACLGKFVIEEVAA